MFLHGSLFHIFFNMLMLYVFGREMEETLGTRVFMTLYLGCGALAGLGWLAISGVEPALCIGASGAVYGIMGAFAAVYPDRRVVLFPFPIVMTMRMLAVVLGGIALLYLIAGGGRIAHAAHLAGGVAGYVYGRRKLWLHGVRSRGGPGAIGSVSRLWEQFRANRRRRSYRVLSRKQEPPDREEVDRILDKIVKEGIGSLSRGEREVLQRASCELGTDPGDLQC